MRVPSLAEHFFSFMYVILCKIECLKVTTIFFLCTFSHFLFFWPVDWVLKLVYGSSLVWKNERKFNYKSIYTHIYFIIIITNTSLSLETKSSFFLNKYSIHIQDGMNSIPFFRCWLYTIDKLLGGFVHQRHLSISLSAIQGDTGYHIRSHSVWNHFLVIQIC
jgi:hypothetical protein